MSDLIKDLCWELAISVDGETPIEQTARTAVGLSEAQLKAALAIYVQVVGAAHPGSALINVYPGLRTIHHWFELTYAQYLTLPRSVLQSMPAAWQHRFVGLLEELDATIDWRPKDGQQYRVTLHQPNEDAAEGDDEEAYWGPALDDPLMDYQRGRRRVPLRTEGQGDA